MIKLINTITNLYASKSKQHIKIKPIVYKNTPFSSNENGVLKLNYEQNRIR